ncbi:hypothetical protein RBB50_008401 [Rhinocladiella similis]
MSALVPDSNNNCWFCGFHNISSATVCQGCRGVTMPTQDEGTKLEWTVTSFDPQATTFNSTHASLLFASIRALDGQDRAAIKIGVGLRYATNIGSVYPAVMVIKSPKEGKRFTICGWNEDVARQANSNARLGVARLDNVTGPNNTFWDSVNLALGLDIHFPQWQQYV